MDIPGFYKSHIPTLKINGKSETVGLCPFHDDHHPSLSVNLSSGLYNCFSCGAKGDVFSFYENLREVDFKTALHDIAEQVRLTNTTTAKPKVVATFEYKDARSEER